MSNRKVRIWSIVGFVVLVLLLWVGLNIRAAVYRAMEAEQQGAAYRTFFVAVDQYTGEHGRLPDSFDELRDEGSVIKSWEVDWQEPPSYMVELINPDFSVVPTEGNFGAFVPGYESKNLWSEYDCRWLWGRIAENCIFDD